MYVFSILMIIFLLICIFGLLLSYEFIFNDNTIHTKILSMLDMPIYLRRAHREHLKDVYDYCINLEHHSLVLAEHFDKQMLSDRDLKVKINKVKETINGNTPSE
jgi:hypothetical protein